MNTSAIYTAVSVLFCIHFVVCNRTKPDRNSKNKGGSQIVFPGSAERESKEIPLEVIQRLNEVSNIEEMFDNFVPPGAVKFASFAPSIAARIGSDDTERNALKSAKMATCMPELKTVPLKPDKTSATFYYPSCTRVERCGGCCSHHLLSCQPVESEILPLSVVIAEYKGGNRLHYRGKQIVEVEKHTKCKCDCKIRPENCSKYQKYSQKKCRCECTNSDEEIKCYDEAPKKIWNTDNCSCMCREIVECESGSYFDPFSCSCLPHRPRKIPSLIYEVK